MWFKDTVTGREMFGVGVGTLVLAANSTLLSLYTFSCHSLRHLVGGGRDSLASSPVMLTSWRCVSCLNQKHMLYAWMSLVCVGFSDVYVRLCSMGIWHDWRILG